MKEYQLEYLLAVVEMKNFTYAARYLSITQPTLSKAISTLEEEIGFQLFVRNRGGIILTDEGVKFVAQAKNVVREMNELGNCISRIKAKATEITVGVNPLLGSIFVPYIEKAILEENPEIAIHWIEDGSYGLEEKLNNGSIDVAILASEYVNADKFCVKQLCTIEEVLCVNENHPLAEKKSVKIEDIKNEKFVLFQERANQGLVFRNLKITPKKSSYSSQISTAMNLVAVGKGVMIIDRPIYEKFKDIYNVKALSIDPKLEINVVVVHKESNTISAEHIEKVVDIITRSVK